MSCYGPVAAWYAQRLNPSGKRSLVFNPREGFLDKPVEIPCGKCVGCKADQALAWSIRAYHESTLYEQNCFITLTYADEHLPADRQINKRDVQLFFKRLRKALGDVRIRYLACGEYGDQTRRPHYHAILFNVDFRDARSIAINHSMYTHPVLEKAWGKGQVVIAPVTMSSICYTCGYVLKKLDSPDDSFVLMSRRPGIGKHWMETQIDDLKRLGKVVIEGREYVIPSRYFAWAEEELSHVKEKQRKYAIEKSQKDDPVTRARKRKSREINRLSLTKQKVEKL